MQPDQPIFILGNPRSGTTLLRLMINAHHAICVPPECGFLEWWHSRYKNWNLQKNNEDDITVFIKDLQTSKKIETWKLDYILLRRIIQDCNPVGYAHLCALVYYVFSLQQNKTIQYWGDKNNYYIHKLPLLHQLYPAAKYIMVVRDGRDVAASYRGIEKIITNSVYKPKLPQAIQEIASEWLTNNRNILNFLNHPHKKYFIVRYEDLVKEPRIILEELCAWLCVAFDVEMMQYYIKNEQNNDEPAATLDWKKKTLEPPDTNRIGSYKTEFNRSEIKLFEETAGELLTYFDYR